MKVFDKSITRSLVNTLLPLLLTAFAAQVHAASMNDYCVMPPYVRTNVKPNIMIMMDNAVDMGEPAYTLGYDPATPYSGYYKKGLKYSYASGRWQPDVNGIYSGNLLNWVTTSKYDLLEGILVGGISTSRQSQINTLISKSNSWQKTLTYTDSLGQSRTCIFKINNANVEITEDTVGACGYLFDATYPPQPIPGDPRPSVSSLKPERQFAESFYPYAQHLPLNGVSSNLQSGIRGALSSLLTAVTDFLVPSAEAASSQLRISGGPSNLPDGRECASYAVGISASGGSEQGYTWSITSGSLPPGLTLALTGTPSATISGIPSASGPYNFTVTVTDNATPANTDSKAYTIQVLDATVTIMTTSPLQEGYVGAYYYVPLNANSACSSSYTWAVTSGSLPPGFSILGGNFVQCGSPANVGTYNFTLQVTDGASNTASQAFTLRINPAPVGLTISTGSPLNNAAVGAYYFIYIETVPGSGTSPFSWSLTSGSLPPGLTLGGGTNYYTSISGTPTGTQTTDVTYSFTITVHDGIGRTNSKDFSLIVSPPPRKIRTSGNLNVKICAGDYANNCTINENTSPLKSGLIDEFWSKARFGVMDFNKSQNIHAVPNIANCIEQNPGATPDPNFLSGVENAVAIDPITTLVNGEYEAVNYFATESSPNCNPYTNATTCTKNFILMLTAGVGADNPTNPDTGLSAEMFSSGVPASCTAATLSNLAKNACYGYNHPDLRADVSGRQYVGTYIVNTMGTPPSNGYTADDAPVTSGDRLKQAAVKGGGTYYGVTDPATLKSRLEQALQDIIKRAAAGTAASVLASGQGSGANLIQAVFYPRRKFGDTEIAWTGRLTNFWYYVDPFFSNSTIREDDGNKVLNLKTDNTNHDYITSLYFSGEATMAKRWPDANGDGIVDGPALIPDIEFEKLGNLWEAGTQLWSRDLDASPRTIYTSITGTSFVPFVKQNNATLRDYLQASSDGESEAIIRYVLGEDTPFNPAITGFSPDYRPRTVSIDLNGDGDVLDAGEGPKTWKLGDVLNSTPKISTWMPLSDYHHKNIYSDTTYGDLDVDPALEAPANSNHYIETSGYKGRGMIFAGANDGMLHAFRLGTLQLKWDGQSATEKARLRNTVCSLNRSIGCISDAQCAAAAAGTCTGTVTLGEEAWAYIPKNVLPYLKYTADPGYCHVYSVDLTPFVFDASINKPAACTEDDAANCTRTVSSWRTILIGGMRFGGACRKQGVACNGGTDCVNTPTVDPADPAQGLGYSSYFALDVTDQNNPTLLWEFSHPELGFTTSGPAVIRISALGANSLPDKGKNGKWFVVFGSGPTGPISTSDQQFLGRSDQPLKLFVLNLKDGTLAAPPIPTGIANAFAGSMYNSTLDSDLDYQDDVLYIPYVKKAADGTWTDGGVGRLFTKEDANPSNWVWSKVIDGIGPVTSAVTKLKPLDTSTNTAAKTVWLFFGTGRYFFDQPNNIDDGANQRKIFGIKDPCFLSGPSAFNTDCTTARGLFELTNVTDIANVPTNPNDTNFKGWVIDLDADGVPDATFRAERVITDPLAATTGVVFFTTYKPYRDQCALGGKTFLWAVKYNTGGAAGTLLQGKAIVQVSTGSIEQINIADAFTDAGKRKSAGMEGVPPTMQGLSIMTNPPPVKRVLHMKER